MRFLERPAAFMMASAGSLSLGACGEMAPAEQARIDALLACANRASVAFPMFADKSAESENDQSEPEFTVAPNGRFVFVGSERLKGRSLPERFVCEGNVTARTIDFVELNGVKKRPQAPDVWKF